MSNALYMLVLDCDMYSNDPTSARRAMCFHLDPEISCSLAFVQYPQMLYNVSKNDIHDNQSRSTYQVHRLKLISICCTSATTLNTLHARFYDEVARHGWAKRPFVHSKFIASLKDINDEDINGKEFTLDVIVEEAMILAGCAFEKGQNGKKRQDATIQIMKWCSGLFQVAFSRFSPLTYDMSRMSILQSMCYGSITFAPLHSISFLIYRTIPQLCFFSGIPLYPKFPKQILKSTIHLV
ncbi:hypothetical protein HYC85_012713 [Camellia sinensis]|uniref:Uncharacterized protein n=1 Tax=Camellia sinensis TaxID=4442 RepID=A0A7J7HCR4_CAMSI|nr:hypothetical protein HYC85_012713 [Camellia sinensis]